MDLPIGTIPDHKAHGMQRRILSHEFLDLALREQEFIAK